MTSCILFNPRTGKCLTGESCQECKCPQLPFERHALGVLKRKEGKK